MNILLVLIVLFAGAACTLAAQPNVLLIISDDQAWTDYGFMQHPHIQTPHIDRLARESLTFTRGYVPASLCRPSLASIITGRYPHEHGIVGNDPPVSGVEGLRPNQIRQSEAYFAARDEYLQHIDGVQTLPRWLAERNYASLQTGKWWEGHPQRGGFTHAMTHGDPRRGGRHGDDGLRIGRQGLDEIFDFMRASRDADRPFFVWYAPMMPHSPHNPPERLLNNYIGKTDSIHVARYWAMCQWFDETCGELLAFLDREGLANETLVVYVTDNGWINQVDSGEFAPKSKRSPYDGGLRTPIMLRWPGRIAPRTDEETLASSLDIVPTVLRAVGISPDQDFPGIDLLNDEQRAARHVLFGEIFEHDVQDMNDPLASLQYRWMIDGYWKMIVPRSERVPQNVLQLYDLRDDPLETRNLAQQQPQRVLEMTKRLNEWWPAAAAEQ